MKPLVSINRVTVHLFDSWEDAYMYCRDKDKATVVQIPSINEHIWRVYPHGFDWELHPGTIEPVDHRKEAKKTDIG